MTRILYVECREGEPYADAQGVVMATTCKPPLPPKPWEWLPYVPAAMHDNLSAALLMVGSELSGDPKIDPDDTSDPRWAPVLREARSLRAERDQALARVRELEELFGRWQNAAARIAAPYHVSVDGEGCPRLHFCQSCQERRTIRDAILAMKPEDVGKVPAEGKGSDDRDALASVDLAYAFHLVLSYFPFPRFHYREGEAPQHYHQE